MRPTSKDGKTNVPLVFAVCLTVGATLYSLNELHRISVEHHKNDAAFMTHHNEAKKEEKKETTMQTLSPPPAVAISTALGKQYVTMKQ
jgi:hypothetical protein